MKKNVTHYFIIGTFVTLYLIVSAISTVHVINFFELSNPRWLAISLALAFEVGAAASLSSLIILEKMNKFLVWTLFIILTAMQAMGNTYYAYTHLKDFQYWSELFGIMDEDVIFKKRLLSIISGAILPIVSLGFIKSLVDYIKPDGLKKDLSDSEHVTQKDEQVESVDVTPLLSETLQSEEVQPELVNSPETDIQPDRSGAEINRVDDSWAPEKLEPVNYNSYRINDPVLRHRLSLKNKN